MENNIVLREAKKLYDMGFAIHWLHRKSKRPVESKWTTGPRKSWDELNRTYQKGFNVGVRLGTPSKIKDNFLSVIDVDVKSEDANHRKEVEEKLSQLIGNATLPEVQSGRGNGSRHYYIVTPTPVVPFKALQSPEKVKVSMPSVLPSKTEQKILTLKEIESGIRLRNAWEIGIMGEGQQVVLPPSIHPDSGKNYKWEKDFKWALAKAFDFSKLVQPVEKPVGGVDNSKPLLTLTKPGPKTLDGFEVTPVEISWLPISEKIKNMIITGEGVEDRSASLMPIATALHKAGLTDNEVLTILTDKDNYIGQTGYHHAKTTDRTRAARWVYKYTLGKVIQKASGAEMFSDPIVKTKQLSDEKIIENLLSFEEMQDWKSELEVTKDFRIRGTLFNVMLVLENEIGQDVIKRDTFAYRDFYSKDTPWGGEKDKAIVDDDLVKIKLWLSRNFGFEPNTNTIGDALTVIATNNAFDPVVEWLDGLPEWDGVPRLDTWLRDHFEAKGSEEYLAQVFRKWIVAMVMRSYEPGTKFDWMPIFEGAQGVGKSSFGRLLCGDKYFLDWLPDLGNKDSALALQGIWSVEMGELAQFRKNEIETVKAFISRTVDKVRPPYGERWLEVPRRCVFFGTTNFETYLRDESGNRRFKPLKVGRLNFEALLRDREQIFSEAIWLYRSGFETERTLELEGDARIYELTIQSDKMVADDSNLMFESLCEFIEKNALKDDDEKFNFSKFKIADLFDVGPSTGKGVPPLKPWKFDSRNVQFAAKSLKKLGAANWRSNGIKWYKLGPNQGGSARS